MITPDGDRSTFDDFDWDFDIEGKSGLGSSFSQRILLQEEPLKKQIHKLYDFYVSIVGGKDKVDTIFLKNQGEEQKLIKN